MFLKKLNIVAEKFKQEFQVYRLVVKHKRTPMMAKVFLSIAVGYVILPFDLIPDFIPVLGQLDDLIIVPFLVFLSLKFVPEDVIMECRVHSKENK